MKPTRTRFIVSLVVPDGVSKSDTRNYITDAVESYRGGLHPNDPLSRIGSTKVTNLTKPVAEAEERIKARRRAKRRICL